MSYKKTVIWVHELGIIVYSYLVVIMREFVRGRL